MRLSTIKGDAGFKPDSILQQYTIWFDGEQVRDCEIADEEKGMIRQIYRHRNPLTRQIMTRRLEPKFGKVEIRLKL